MKTGAKMPRARRTYGTASLSFVWTANRVRDRKKREEREGEEKFVKYRERELTEGETRGGRGMIDAG